MQTTESNIYITSHNLFLRTGVVRELARGLDSVQYLPTESQKL